MHVTRETAKKGENAMLLYDDNGYANMAEIMEMPTPFILVIGGRGTGKTYSAIKAMLRKWLDTGDPFLYLRRTSAQMELISKEEFSPIVKVGREMGINLTTEPLSKYASGVYLAMPETGEIMGKAAAYVMALSTMAAARSFDASAVKTIIYDECIPENHERAIKAEDMAFLNMYESIDRNRQLNGEEPVKCICIANANSFDAPILRALNAIKPLERMRNKKQSVMTINATGLSIVLLRDSPISMEKAATALYQLQLGQGDFTRMALDNDFSADSFADIVSRPLGEYVPKWAVKGRLCVYQHKSNHTYYVSELITGSPDLYESTVTDRQRFRLKAAPSWEAYFEKRTLFETAAVKSLYRLIMNER